MNPTQRRRKGSIRNRILIPHLVLIVAMVGGTGLVCAHWAASRARRQYVERGQGIAETLMRSRFPLTESVLQQLKGLGGAEFALLDDGGRVQSSTLGLPDALPRWPSAFGSGTNLSFEPTWTHQGVEYRVATVERPTASTAHGERRLLILLPEPTLRATAWEARRAILALSLVGAVLAALLASAVGRTLSRPLSAIHHAIRQIGQGNLRPTGLPRDRLDEIGELAEGVAQMAQWLQRLQDEQVQTERLRLIRQVSAGLAHELRNPLTAARMTLQIFMERNRDRDTEPLEIAMAELGRVERQVRRFLQIARPEPPRFVRTEIGPIVERAAATLAANAEHQRVGWSVEPADSLPLVRVDPEQMGQVITNLALNAIDAAGPGGRARIRAGLTPSGAIAIDVEDNGPGVSAGDEARLFQPFFSTKPEGVGLGLALCDAIVREHGGAIEYRRNAGWTRFRITLPAVTSTQPHISYHHPAKAPMVSRPAGDARDPGGEETL